MVTLTFRKIPRPQFRIGSRVRAIKDMFFYNIDAEGTVVYISDDPSNPYVNVKFDKGNYKTACNGIWCVGKKRLIVIG